MKNKYYLDIQTDKAWCNDTMAMQGDMLGLYGCLVTALSNTKILQGVPYTPKIFNQELKSNKGYAGLRFPKLTENQSFILWKSDKKGRGVNEILGCSTERDTKLTMTEIDAAIKRGNTFFIARVILTMRNQRGIVTTFGHYINILYVLNNKYICFDTYDGRVNILDESDITLKIKVEYK